MKRKWLALSLLAVAWICLPTPSRAEGTRFHSYEGFNALLEGDAKGSALAADGLIELTSPSERLFEEKDGRLAASAVGGGRVALVMADSGKLVVLEENGKRVDYGQVPKGVVTAAAIGKNTLYVATLSPVKIYRVSAPQKFEALPLPQHNKREIGAVWAILDSPRGLLVATGAPGAVFRFEKDRFVELFKSSEDSLRSLALDAGNRLYVGGGSKGILYRGGLEKGPFLALYDTGLDELTDLLPAAAGDVFIVGLAGAQGGGEHDGKGEKLLEKGKIRAQLIHLDAEGFAEVIAGSDDEILYAVTRGEGARVLVSTGSVDKDNLRGRVYSAEPKSREISLIYQTKAAQVVRLAQRGDKLLVVGNDPPEVVAFGRGYNREGEYTLPVFDAGVQSRFGSVQLDGETPAGTQIAVKLRTGQVATPDDTWTAWTKEMPVGLGQPNLPAARFVQARLVLRSDGKQTPRARRVRIAYARQNLAPYVAEVTLLAKGVALAAVPAEQNRERTVTVSDKGLQELKRVSPASPGDDGRESGKAKQTIVSGALSVAWSAQDPNGDSLKFDLYYRGAGDRDFRLLKADLTQPFYTFEAAALPDGRYQFRVVAKDEESNPPGMAKQDSRDSLWFTLDNAPPSLSKFQVDSGKAIRFEAKDSQSLIVKADYSIDGAPLRPLISRDGLLDSRDEAFEMRVPKLGGGQHTATFRVEDEAGNVGAGEVRF